MDPKITFRHNSRSALTIFSKFCKMKGGQKLHENCIDGFPKKNLSSGKMGHLGSKNDGWAKLWICPKEFFKLWTIKDIKKCIKIILWIFPEKKSFRAIGSFSSQKWCVVIYVDPLGGFTFTLVQWSPWSNDHHYILCFAKYIVSKKRDWNG